MATAEEEVAGEAVVVGEAVVGVGEEVELGEEVDGTKEDMVDMAEREGGTGINFYWFSLVCWYELNSVLSRDTAFYSDGRGNLSDFMDDNTVFSILLFLIFYHCF